MLIPDVAQTTTATIVWLSLLLAMAVFALEFGPWLWDRATVRGARARLRVELSTQRIARMLAYRKVALADFVARLAPIDLERATASCRNCSSAARCEAVLRNELPAGAYAFCPSRNMISRVAQVLVPSHA